MYLPVSHKILKHQFWLSTDRTLFWEEERALILSDMHFGKTGHFRKSGIAVPAAIYKEDLQRLVNQIQYFQPRQLIIVGDMFHSHANAELELFLRWRSDLSGIDIRLIKGNHDILKSDWYAKAGIEISSQTHSVEHFHFVHDVADHLAGKNQPLDKKADKNSYFFSGHIHPGIRIQGAGRQSLCFPCFYFGKKYAVLPAFSRFTGIAMIYPEAEEQVFAIVNQELIQLQ
jgi:uncharacterized protein